MPDTKKLNQHNRAEKKPSGAHTYNPGNMAGETIEKRDDAPHENKTGEANKSADDYNPGNMAGKKADKTNDGVKQQPRTR